MVRRHVLCTHAWDENIMYLLEEMTILFVGSYPVTYKSFTLSRISSVHRKCINKCTLPFFH